MHRPQPPSRRRVSMVRPPVFIWRSLTAATTKVIAAATPCSPDRQSIHPSLRLCLLLAGDAVVVPIEMRRVAGITLLERCHPGGACLRAVLVVNVGVGRPGSQQRTAEECRTDGRSDCFLHSSELSFVDFHVCRDSFGLSQLLGVAGFRPLFCALLSLPKAVESLCFGPTDPASLLWPSVTDVLERLGR